MNIQLHYFTVKYLSVMSRFTLEESQIIAEASQFINDSKEKIPYDFAPGIVPQLIKDRGLCEDAEGKLRVFLPKTAADVRENELLLNEDEKNELLDSDVQLNCLAPFHYFPDAPITLDEENVPEDLDFNHAIINFEKHTVFSPLAKSAIEQYKESASNPDLTKEALIRIGVLTHIIADSFAHEYMVGFESWINDIKIRQIQVNKTYEDKTADYVKCAGNPKVGRYRLGNTPEDCSLNTVYAQLQNEGSTLYSRNHQTININSFISAAKQIYMFLLKLKNQEFDLTVWNGYCIVLSKLFNKCSNDASALATEWEAITNITGYSYNFDTVKELFLKEERIFSIILIADDIRKAIAVKPNIASNYYEKNKPAKDLNLEIEPIAMDGSQFTFKVNGAYSGTEKDMPLNLVLQVYNFTKEQQLFSRTFNSETNTITGSITEDILNSKDTYKMLATLLTTDKSHINSKEVDIVFGNVKDIIKFTPDSDKVVVYNIKDYIKEHSYSYPENADYINQNDSHLIDILLPVMGELKITSDYRFKCIKNFYAELINDNNKLKYVHCNNKKFNLITINDTEDQVLISLNEDWKNQFNLVKYILNKADMRIDLGFDAEIEYVDKSQLLIGTREVSWSMEKCQKDAYGKIKFIWQADADE